MDKENERDKKLKCRKIDIQKEATQQTDRFG